MRGTCRRIPAPATQSPRSFSPILTLLSLYLNEVLGIPQRSMGPGVPETVSNAASAASALLLDGLPELAAAATRAYFQKHPEAPARWGENGQPATLADNQFHLRYLAEALRPDAPSCSRRTSIGPGSCLKNAACRQTFSRKVSTFSGR